MRNPQIKLAYDTHRDKPVVSLSFEKEYCPISEIITLANAGLQDHTQELPGHLSSKTTEIYPAGIYFNNWEYSKINKISKGVNMHVSNKNLGLIKNPLDEIFDNTS